jgi:hypothetical protein
MIKYITAIALTIISFTALHAQYKSDSWMLSPKISFADYSDQKNSEDYSISKIPPISVFLEKGMNNFLSAGGFAG